ncbi:hypothetical protein, partial [Klebsiella pneumoniae]
KTQPATGETYPKSDLFNKAAMRFKSFQQQFFKHKRINFPQVVNFLWEARQRLYALQHPPRTLLLPFVSSVAY